jgi:hypothetical protein
LFAIYLQRFLLICYILRSYCSGDRKHQAVCKPFEPSTDYLSYHSDSTQNHWDVWVYFFELKHEHHIYAKLTFHCRTSSLAIVEIVAGSAVDGGDFAAGAYINVSFNQDTNKA